MRTKDYPAKDMSPAKERFLQQEQPEAEMTLDFRDRIKDVQLWTNNREPLIEIELNQLPDTTVQLKVRDIPGEKRRHISAIVRGNEADRAVALLPIGSVKWDNWAYPLANAHFPAEHNGFTEALNSAYLHLNGETPQIEVTFDENDSLVTVSAEMRDGEWKRVVAINGKPSHTTLVQSFLHQYPREWDNYLSTLFSVHFGICGEWG